MKYQARNLRPKVACDGEPVENVGEGAVDGAEVKVVVETWDVLAEEFAPDTRVFDSVCHNCQE